MKLKKIKKSKTMRGKGMGTHGWGARKKHMGSGHRGGFGMSGTGKKADQKKSLVIKEYDQYFGKQGVTSRSTRKKINNVMNLEYLEKNLEKLKKDFSDKQGILNLKDYKILGRGELKTKITIKAKSISVKAKQAIEKVGGKVILPEVKKEEKKEVPAAEETKAEQK